MVEERTMTHNTEGFCIRPREPGDDERIVAISNQVESNYWPLSIHEYRLRLPYEGEGERWVALEDGMVVGHASLDVGWWSVQPGIVAIDMRVDRARWGRGIGSLLYEYTLSHAKEHGATRLFGRI